MGTTDWPRPPIHDATEEFWRAAIATNPTMSAEEMTERLSGLVHRCVGPLASFQVQMERALAQAQQFEHLKRERDPK